MSYSLCTREDNCSTINANLLTICMSVSSIYTSLIQRAAWSSRSPTSLIISLGTYNSPPSKITWFRNDQPLDLKQENISANAYITRRSSSQYRLELAVKGTPQDLVGGYSVRVGNYRGTTTRALSSNITGTLSCCLFINI